MILELAFFVTSCLALYSFLNTKSRKGFPPGPRGLPFLGNIFQLETVQPWHTFTKWKDTYGPIVYLQVLGQPMVILNTSQVAGELLEQKAHSFSGRPQFIVGNVITGELNMPLMSFNERWRKMRRLSEHLLGPKHSGDYHRFQNAEGILLAHAILNQTHTWMAQIERASSSTSLALVYDLPPIQSLQDPLVTFMNQAIDAISKSMIPGAYLVEVLPALRHLPKSLSWWEWEAKRVFNELNLQYEKLFLKIKHQVAKGYEQSPSFSASLAESQASHHLTDQECAWLSGVLYNAGFETTATTLLWFIAAMVSFPECQQHAHEELDQVVGCARPPSFEDLEHLPYIQAIVKEVLRWRPALPLSVPHIATEDHYYHDFFIPKGAICIPNILAMNHDPETYGENANEFFPNRYLDEEGNLKDPQSEGHFTYGFGQRICVGRRVANNTLFIQIATLLWAVQMEAPNDGSGNPLKLDLSKLEDPSGVFMRPKPFDIVCKPRFPDAEILLQQTKEEIMEEIHAHRESLA